MTEADEQGHVEIRGSWVTLGKVSQTWQTLARTLPGARESLFRLLRIYSLGDELKEEIEAPHSPIDTQNST